MTQETVRCAGRMRCKVELCDPVTMREFMDLDYLVRGGELGRIQNSIRSLMLPPPPRTDHSLDTIWYFIPRSDCGTKRGHKFASHELLIKLSFPNSQSIFHPTSIEHRGTNCNTAPPTIFNHGYSTAQNEWHIEENHKWFSMHLLKTTYFVLLTHNNVPNVTLPRVLHRPGPASRGRVRHVASLTLNIFASNCGVLVQFLPRIQFYIFHRVLCGQCEIQGIKNWCLEQIGSGHRAAQTRGFQYLKDSKCYC